MALAVENVGQTTDNTTNPAYGAADIHNIYPWAAFNLQAIRTRYGVFLQQRLLPDDPMPISPPARIASEMGVPTA